MREEQPPVGVDPYPDITSLIESAEEYFRANPKQEVFVWTFDRADVESLKAVISAATQENRNAVECEQRERALKARAERAEAERTDVVKLVSQLAREAGEAKGKLEASELAGVVDGWIERAKAAEADRDRLVEALTNISRLALMPNQPTVIGPLYMAGISKGFEAAAKMARTAK